MTTLTKADILNAAFVSLKRMVEAAERDPKRCALCDAFDRPHDIEDMNCPVPDAKMVLGYQYR